MYPPSVGSGDYSDSYTQIDKDTVLRLRGEMVPEMGTKFLPGSRLSSLPSADDIANVLENVTSNPLAVKPVAVAAEPVAVAAEPVAVAAEPVAVAAEPIAAAESVPVTPTKPVEEETEDMDFDMEWD